MYRWSTIHYSYSRIVAFCIQIALNHLITSIVSACSDVRNKLFLRQKQSVSPKETKCFRHGDKWKQMLERVKATFVRGTEKRSPEACRVNVEFNHLYIVLTRYHTAY